MTKPPSSTPQEIGRYRVERVLGRGAMGSVYLATDPLIQRRVALKTIRADLLQESTNDDGLSSAEWSARFINEARAAGRLVHPHIVAVFDYGEADGTAYIALEYVDGGNLAERLAIQAGQHVQTPLLEALVWFAQLLDALAYAHDLGVVHRDIKPANLLIGARGECKVADFGIAQLDTGRLTAVGMMIGTPSYMSPEQYSGHEVDARSDLFSAGVVLYEMVTGHCPFAGNAAAVMRQVLDSVPAAASTLVPTLPHALDAMLGKALAKRPDDRYASAQAWRAEVLDLVDVLSGRSGGASAHSAPQANRGNVAARPGTAGLARSAMSPAYEARPGAQSPQGLTPPNSAFDVVRKPSAFSEAMLADLERRLASHVGPVASLLVKRAVARSTDTRALAAQLARHAPDEAARREIDATLARYEAPSRASASASASRLLSTGKADVAGSIPSLTNGSGHARGNAGGSANAHAPVLDNDLVKAAARLLASHIGPVASIVARRATQGADTETFFNRLADAVPGTADKTALLVDLRKLRR
ncbi:eukaryotic-like serine/threonine-protein kinase [Pararobbsia alpina]|uniref:serine/threonine-protein kinase n=1 Tax=Pararobbsia alpina TaxID=621374 RepID=UPI0039A70149